jgi:hypothetical protein
MDHGKSTEQKLKEKTSYTVVFTKPPLEKYRGW